MLKSWARAVKALRAKMAAASVCICINGGDGEAPPGQGLAANGVAYMQLLDCLWHFQVHGHVCLKRLFAQDFSLLAVGLLASLVVASLCMGRAALKHLHLFRNYSARA